MKEENENIDFMSDLEVEVSEMDFSEKGLENLEKELEEFLEYEDF